MTSKLLHSCIACLAVAVSTLAPGRALEQTKIDVATVDAKLDAAADPKAGGKAGAKTDAKTDTKTDARTDGKTGGKTGPKAEGKGDAKLDAKAQSDAQQFCMNNAALLGDARIAFQTARLTEIEAQMRRRLAELASKQAEFEAWLRKRDDAMKQAADGVVAIYAKMRPDAAASQLAAMDDGIAAAILAKLSPRSAGAILNEMEASRAARLTRAMADPDAAPDGKKS